MTLSKSYFKNLGIMTMNTERGIFYQLRLSNKFGRKTIGLGSDELQALNIASLVDEEITRILAAREELDVDALKSLVQNELYKLREKKKGNIRVVQKDDLSVLWENYVSFHVSLNAWSESYLGSHISLVRRMLESAPYKRLEEKQQLIEWVFSDNSRTKATSKERFKLVVAAVDWNSKQGYIPRKWGIEWRDTLESMNVRTKKKSVFQDDESQIDIFSVEEIYRILEAFRSDAYSRFKGKHSQYYEYAYFCWLTGCRPSEACALKWENIDLKKKRIKFCEVEMTRNGQNIKRQGTKTVLFRYFPVNDELLAMLESSEFRRGYVFRNDKNKPIQHQAFYAVWGTVLNALKMPYRNPYQLRHTMISYHANNDYPIQKLAEIVGNSEQVIREYYLRLNIEKIALPNIIR